MQAQARVEIVEARAAHDLQVEDLACTSGLTVKASAEREHEHALLLVAEYEGTVHGFALGWLVADELELVDIAVAVPSRGRGIGQALIHELFARARARGCASAFLEARASNIQAQALYLKVGFERTGSRPSYYRNGEDAWLFRCCLQAPA